MAKERVKLMRNTGSQETPVWEQWFAKTVADAVMMSDADGETQNVKQYVDKKIADLIGGAPSTFDTLKEIADYIAAHKEISDALDAAIGNKVDKVNGKQLSTNDYTTAEKEKLSKIATNANNYKHPESHAASMITQDATHRFTTDAEKESWSAKANVVFASSLPAKAAPGTICFLI